jgi:hypothetical protein
MYGMTDPTVAARLAKLYVDERVRDAEARRVARAVRRETRAKNTHRSVAAGGPGLAPFDHLTQPVAPDRATEDRTAPVAPPATEIGTVARHAQCPPGQSTLSAGGLMIETTDPAVATWRHPMALRLPSSSPLRGVHSSWCMAPRPTTPAGAPARPPRPGCLQPAALSRGIRRRDGLTEPPSQPRQPESSGVSNASQPCPPWPRAARTRQRRWPDLRERQVGAAFSVQVELAPPTGFEPALPAPEAGALSPELRGPRLRAQDYQPGSATPAVQMIGKKCPTVSGGAVRSRP